MRRSGGGRIAWMRAARRVAGALGFAALAVTSAAQATIILEAEPDPGLPGRIRVELVSLDGISDVLQLSAALTLAPLGVLDVLEVQYPAIFSPATPQPSLFPIPGASSARLARPTYLFAAGAVDIAPGALFSWLFEMMPGAEGPFSFAAELQAWPPAEDRLPVVLSARTSFAAVPEPGTGVLLGAALAAWLVLARRRRRRAALA